MKSLPYFRWYPADAEGDDFYAGLTDAEGWTFTRLLNRSWMNDGIPSDLGAMARVIGRTRAQMERVWPKLSQRWEQSPRDPAKLVNQRQELEREIAVAKSENNKRPGNANAFKTRFEKNANGSQHAQARADSDSVSDSGSVSSEKGSGEKPTGPTARMTLSGMRWKSDEQYARFVADYLGTGAALIDADFADAYEFCWRTLDFSQKLARVSSLTRHAEEYHADPRFVPKPRKFLETEWERQVRPLPRGPKSSESLADRTIALVQRRIANGDNPL